MEHQWRQWLVQQQLEVLIYKQQLLPEPRQLFAKSLNRIRALNVTTRKQCCTYHFFSFFSIIIVYYI